MTILYLIPQTNAIVKSDKNIIRRAEEAMEEREMWIDKIVKELGGMDAKTVSLVYFFVIGLKGKKKKQK